MRDNFQVKHLEYVISDNQAFIYVLLTKNTILKFDLQKQDFEGIYLFF